MRSGLLTVLAVAAAVAACRGSVPPATPPSCDPAIGVVAPLRVCSAAEPCLRPLRGDPISASTTPPLCKTTKSGRPVFDDGPARVATDAGGIARQACVFAPPGATADAPRPLLVFMHGSSGSADDVYNFTSLRAKATSFDLTKTGARPGFFLLAVQARNLHWPTSTPEDGSKHDIYHRSLAVPSTNADLANLDRAIDELVAGGAVDRERIFITGWSNGARFAQLYAIARHDTPTAGGNRVRAAAVYSGTDPFNGFAEAPSCALAVYPKSTVPIMLIGRACDLLPCNAAQAADLGMAIDPGDAMEAWVSDLHTKVGDPNVSRIIIDADGKPVSACAERCRSMQALINHVRWPDGIADGGGVDHELTMLSFLRESP